MGRDMGGGRKGRWREEVEAEEGESERVCDGKEIGEVDGFTEAIRSRLRSGLSLDLAL